LYELNLCLRERELERDRDAYLRWPNRDGCLRSLLLAESGCKCGCGGVFAELYRKYCGARLLAQFCEELEPDGDEMLSVAASCACHASLAGDGGVIGRFTPLLNEPGRNEAYFGSFFGLFSNQSSTSLNVYCSINFFDKSLRMICFSSFTIELSDCCLM
jgi:hypothetical protein